jgi:predicted DNA-binding WGR domain protein
MAIILHRIDPDRNMRRWYAVGVQSTLFHRHAVVCGWGRLGTDYARWRIIPADTREQAEAAAQEILERKRKRGYK